MKKRLIERNALQAAECLTEMEDKEYLRSTDVTRIFSISNSTLKLMRARGELPCYRLGKTYLYKKEEIEACLVKLIAGRE
ncbi:helix-turn-helix domain-containing protein [Bacteroides sp. KH569_7]|uniref:Helix-turn-helix domain-containing protein n=1 Tax=Bacteroides muris (ex Fokt et al. 2023) TaxID=2937417 RepID=A0A9X2SYD7_9BACE|nr:helix-turn-helix domain-containing protein [Bacteroides muris (ex Fokt et al. 2023)]MCR6509880.1 helix-turn-helix domain-containing protein [Bacteroides muris (ex Fokt et al. 2023)]